MHRTFSLSEGEFAHEELKMSSIQPSCELHLGGSERDHDRHREGMWQAGAKPWRGAFWHNDSHLPLTGLGKVKLIMTAHRCWIALDEVNNWQFKKQVLHDLCSLPWNYRVFRFFPEDCSKKQSNQRRNSAVLSPSSRKCSSPIVNNILYVGREKACPVTCHINDNCHWVEKTLTVRLFAIKAAW